MKRLLLLVLILLGFSSCRKILEPLYIRIPGTNWSYELDGKRAFIQFSYDDKATVLQVDLSNGAVQENNGTYTTLGHRVDIVGEDGTTFNLTRTFSHLKNSKDKNMTRFFPVSHSSLAGTVWAGMDMADMSIYYFKDEENLRKAVFSNGWTVHTLPYTLNGGTFTVDGETGWLYSEVLSMDGMWHVSFPAPGGEGESAEMAGTLWIHRAGALAGAIVFDSGHSFTFVQAAADNRFIVERGTYSKSGDVLTMRMMDQQSTCTVSGGTFSFMGLTYKLAD